MAHFFFCLCECEVDFQGQTSISKRQIPARIFPYSFPLLLARLIPLVRSRTLFFFFVPRDWSFAILKRVIANVLNVLNVLCEVVIMTTNRNGGLPSLFNWMCIGVFVYVFV